MSRIFKIPFATQGDRAEVPVPTQGDGSVSMTQGFGIDYEREYEDPAAKDIRREDMNGLLFDITQALGELQSFGFAQWAAVSGGWPVGAMVRHDGKYWQSHENANEGTPGDPETGLGWKEILLGNVVPATEAIRGLVHLATAADAKTFTGQGVISAQVLGDAMNSHVLGMGQTWQDVTAERSLNTTYTNTSGRTLAFRIFFRASFSNDLGRVAVSVWTGEGVFNNYHYTNISGSTQFSDGDFIIPAGDEYLINIIVTNGSLQNFRWEELRA